MTTDVVIAGGGPNGLLMACELALAGVRATVLERLPERATAPKANGLVGRVVQALDYRGLYERFSGSSGPPVPAPGFAFGALPLDLSALAGNALYTLPDPAAPDGRAARSSAPASWAPRSGAGTNWSRCTRPPTSVTRRGAGPARALRAHRQVPCRRRRRAQHRAQGLRHRLPRHHRPRLRQPQRAGHHPPARRDTGHRGTARFPVPAGSGPRPSPVPRTACSPTGCSSLGSTGCLSTSGSLRRWRTATRCHWKSCGPRCAGSSAATCR